MLLPCKQHAILCCNAKVMDPHYQADIEDPTREMRWPIFRVYVSAVLSTPKCHVAAILFQNTLCMFVQPRVEKALFGAHQAIL